MTQVILSPLNDPEYWANSGSPQDIQNAIDTAFTAGGGTVYVPEGDFIFEPTYDGAVKVPRGINVICAGKDKTIFRNVVPVPYNDWGWGVFFSVGGSGPNDKSVRLQGFTIIGFRELYPDHDARTRGISIRQVKDFVVKDVKIKDTGGSGISVCGWLSYGPVITQGVITHCDLINTSGKYAGPGGTASGPNVLGYGVQVDGSGRAADWVDDISQVLGKYDYGRTVVYVEDCYFERWRHDIASNQNAHYVFRHNELARSLAFGNLDAHGAGYGNERVGTRAVEIYNNTLRTPAPDRAGQMQAVAHRGGGGVYFGNTVEQGYRYFAHMVNDSSGLPELQKFWTNDVWVWNNALASSISSPTSTYDPLGQIIEGVNYHNNAPPFTYTQYPYPHPLVSGETPPPPPQNVTPWANSLEEGTYKITMPAQVQVGSDIYNFKQWEDGSTNPVRTTNLMDQDYTLTAVFAETTTPPPPPTNPLVIFAILAALGLAAAVT